MKKILHMTPPIINNGVYKYIFNHMKYLDKDKYCFDFLTRNTNDLMATAEYAKYHFQIQSFQNTEREGRDGLRNEIERILSQGYYAVHLHTSYWRGFLIEEIAMEMQIPRVIVHSHSSGIDVEDKAERKKLRLIHEDYKSRFNKKYATDFCACSQLAADWLYGTQIPKSEIKLLHNAIEVNKYLFNSQIREKSRVEYGVNDRIVVGTVGRFCYQKNHEFLVKAFAQAHDRNNKLFLLLIGEGELKKDIQSLIERLNLTKHVLCMGWQEDIENKLQMMDVFCLPSKFEGFPISLIEAQAAGLKCLVSKTITGEIKITELITFLSLNMNEWVEAIAQSRVDRQRKNMDDIITRQGYNITNEIKSLEKIYG